MNGLESVKLGDLSMGDRFKLSPEEGWCEVHDPSSDTPYVGYSRGDGSYGALHMLRVVFVSNESVSNKPLPCKVFVSFSLWGENYLLHVFQHEVDKVTSAAKTLGAESVSTSVAVDLGDGQYKLSEQLFKPS